jgi:hypothetical protein
MKVDRSKQLNDKNEGLLIMPYEIHGEHRDTCPKIELADVVHRGIHNSYMKATCNHPRARFGGLLFPPHSQKVLYILRRIIKIFFFPKDFIKRTLVFIFIFILKILGGGKGMVERICLT